MTYHTYLECDRTGCTERVEEARPQFQMSGAWPPVGWLSMVVSVGDDRMDIVHFCSAGCAAIGHRAATA